MKRITSFTVDHDKIVPGIYISRVDGDITTYDLRTRVPNTDDLMDHVTMHSMEHMLATFMRNSPLADDVIYFGPMGCRTGFYLLMRNANHEAVLATLKKALSDVVGHTGEMFGASRKECGNYRELSLDAAKKEAARYLAVLNASEQTFAYPQ
jgi:S-ribosylhomocysteine lyase